MELLFITIATLFGLVMGSFLNVAILRSATGETLRGRSRCNACTQTLTAIELIPLISFALQKARCRSCDAVLLWQYPLVEASAALAFGLITALYLNVAGDILGLLDFVILAALFTAAATMITISVADLKFHLIPNGAAALLAISGLMISWHRAAFTPDLFYDIGAAIAIAGILASLWFFSKGRWMGFGDAKLVIGTSLLVGFPAAIVAILFAFWLGGIVGVFLLFFGRTTLKGVIPFGPFILAGAILAYYLSDWFLFYTGFSFFFGV